ncbi:MAG: cupin domain-containing protein [Cocleimonas sp.]|nr:cupin domain-containing protein [Cocleimonas sp.]
MLDTKTLLLKAQQIEQMEGEIKTHFLNPNAVRINKSLGDAVGLNNIGVHMIFVDAGKDTTEYHKHYYEEECIYVLSGKGELVIENDIYPFEKGDFVGFPANIAAHSLVNKGDETLICLVFGQRLQHDVADYPNKNKRIYRNSDTWGVVDINNIIDPRKPSSQIKDN